MEHALELANYARLALAVALAVPWLALGAMGGVSLLWLWHSTSV